MTLGKYSIMNVMRINGLEGERGPGAIARPGLLKSLPRRCASAGTKRRLLSHNRANREKFNFFGGRCRHLSKRHRRTGSARTGFGPGKMATRLYTFNVQLSAALYGPLQCLKSPCATSPIAS